MSIFTQLYNDNMSMTNSHTVGEWAEYLSSKINNKTNYLPLQTKYNVKWII